MRFWSGLVECGVFVMLVVLELALANCEFLLLTAPNQKQSSKVHRVYKGATKSIRLID